MLTRPWVYFVIVGWIVLFAMAISGCTETPASVQTANPLCVALCRSDASDSRISAPSATSLTASTAYSPGGASVTGGGNTEVVPLP